MEIHHTYRVNPNFPVRGCLSFGRKLFYMKKHKFSHTASYILLASLFIAAFAERVFFDFGPNFELVTTALILSSFYAGKKESFWIVFLIMLFSDLIIGNTNIFIFTWSGFLIPVLFTKKLIIYVNQLILKFISQITVHCSPITNKLYTSFSLTSTGLISNLFFFFWTNLGVWLLSGMYPNTISGLLGSYVNALPFLKYQLISTLIFIPTCAILTEISIFVFRRLYREGNRPSLSNEIVRTS